MTSTDSTEIGIGDTTPASDANPEAADPGGRIGRYVIVDKLGQGGMGVVYAAYDPELDRKVAVKVLHADAGGTTPRVEKARGQVMQALFGDDGLGSAETAAALDADQQRLLREAQGAARINHPNVVSVYDVGHQSGRVFVAMEFVTGKTLRAWFADGPHPWRAVCKVMAQAGAGLAAAHDRGLIHRDFKPDNVMIDDEGRVRVMDFGLVRPDREVDPDTESMSSSGPMQPTTNALALELTRKGAVAGTPAYMSPEQIAGKELDARSDQFSFCVTLWEGLFGKRPFTGDSLASLAAAVLAGDREDVPNDRDVPAAMRSATERGLSGELTDRWPSMQELVAALQRDPLRARNRAFALGGGALAIVVGVGGWQAHRSTQLAQCEREGQAAGLLWNEDAAVRVREQMLGTGVAYAVGTADAVVPRLDAYTAKWGELAESVCRDEVLGSGSVDSAQAHECLTERRSDLEGTVAALDAVDKTTMVGATLVVAALEPVETCVDEAALARRSLRGDLGQRLREADLRQQVRAASRFEIVGKHDEARTVLAKVLEQTAGQTNSGVRAWAMYELGVLDAAEGHYEDAEANLKDAAFLGTASGDELTVANATSKLVWLVGYRQGRPDDADVWRRWSETLVERLDMVDSLAGAALDERIAMVESSRGNQEAARTRLDHAVAVKRAELGLEHPEVALSLNLLGNVQIKSEGLDEAAATWNESLAILERAYGSSHPDLATPLSNLAQVEFRRGDFVAARAFLERSIDLRAAEVGEDHPEIGRMLSNLALLIREGGDASKARDVLARATEILVRAHGREHPNVAVNLGNLGKIDMQLERPEDALAHYREALAIQKKVLPDDHIDLAVTLSAIGSALRATGKLQDALTHYQRAQVICEGANDPVHVPMTRFHVGRALWELGRRSEAMPLVESAIEGFTDSNMAKEAAVARFLLGRVLAEEPTTRDRGLELVHGARVELAEIGDMAAVEDIDAWKAEQAAQVPAG